MYDPERRSMHCPYCDRTESEEAVAAESMAVCQSCGAEIPFETFTSACRCMHCGNYVIFEEKVSGAYEPHLILPFQIEKNAVFVGAKACGYRGLLCAVLAVRLFGALSVSGQGHPDKDMEKRQYAVYGEKLLCGGTGYGY